MKGRSLQNLCKIHISEMFEVSCIIFLDKKNLFKSSPLFLFLVQKATFLLLFSSGDVLDTIVEIHSFIYLFQSKPVKIHV